MTTQERIDGLLADNQLPAAAKALSLQLVQNGGEGRFELFSASNADHPKDLKIAVKKLVRHKYVKEYRGIYEVL